MIRNNDIDYSKNFRKLNKRLKTKPVVPGVSGIHRQILDRLNGAADAKNSQICIEKGRTLTPYIVRICGRRDGYKSRILAYAVTVLTDVFSDVSALDAEIDNISSVNKNDKKVVVEEMRRRQEAAVEKTKEAREKAARLKEILVSCDENIRHHLEHVDKIIKCHVSGYWRSFLKANAGVIDLPVYPVINDYDFDGFEIYEEHLHKIMTLLNRILEENGEGDEKK
ncbi:MAG: hypothetical protein K6E34_07130 [Lachnospiraceae bacterium]|nr:hypothetical protein [Lachnospiraceae bacterium]